MKQKTKTDSEILNQLIEALGLTANSFAVKLEYKSVASVYHVISGLNQFSQGMHVRILNTFPNVNPDFLKTGEGNPLLDKEDLIHENNMKNIPNSGQNGFFEELYSIPSRINKLIRLQEETNSLLSEFLSKKKDDQ